MNHSLQLSEDNLLPSQIIDEETEFKTSIEFTEIIDGDCLTRLYKKLTFGYTAQTIISIISNILNIFLLSLPYIVHANGLCFGSIILVYVFITSYFSLCRILDVLLKTNALSFHQALYNYVSKNMAMFYNIIYVIYVFGTLLLYQYITFTIVFRIICNLFSIDFNTSKTSQLIIFIVLFVVQIIISQISFIYTKRALFQLITLFTCVVVFIVRVILMILNIINTSTPINNDNDTDSSNNSNIWFKLNTKSFFSYAICVCIFCNVHNYIFPIYTYFELKSQKRIKDVLCKSQTISIIAAFIFCVVIYLSLNVTYDNDEMIILLNTPNDKRILTLIFRVLFSILILTYIATVLENFRYVIRQTITNSPHLTRQQQQQSGLSCLLVNIFVLGISTVIVAIMFEREKLFEMLVCLIGGICLGFIAFVFPSVLYGMVVDGNCIRKVIACVIMLVNGVLGIIVFIYGVIRFNTSTSPTNDDNSL